MREAVSEEALLTNGNLSLRKILIVLFLCFFFSYRLRIESMLLRAEFEANMGFLEPSIESMLAAGEGEFNFEWRFPTCSLVFFRRADDQL